MKTKVSSVFLLLLAACIWGFSFVAQVTGGENIGMFWFNGIRFTIGALVLIPVVLIFERGRCNRVTVLAGIVAGVILCTAANLQQWGINITESSGRSGFITALYTVLVPLLGALFLRKHTNRNTWLGAILAIIGLFLILSGGMATNDTPLITGLLRLAFGSKTAVNATFSVGKGDIVLLGCAVGYAVHILFIDSFSHSVSPVAFSAIQFLTAGVLSTLLALFNESLRMENVIAAAIPLLYCGICSTGIAFTLQTVGQKNADPTVAAIAMSTESIFAAIGGALILHDKLPVIAYVGCAIIFAGIVISQIPAGKRR